MKEKGMSKGEFTSVAQSNGGIENMLNPDAKDKDTLVLIKYIADEDKLEKILENPQVIKTPVVRNGKQSTIGYQPDVWKGWGRSTGSAMRRPIIFTESFWVPASSRLSGKGSS